MSLMPAVAITARIAVAVVFFSVAFGQVNSDQSSKTVRLSGRLISPTGPLLNKEVRLKATGQEEVITTRTNEEGFFSFPSLLPDQHYDLLISVAGFNPWNMGIEVGREDKDLGSLALTPPQPVAVV